MPTSSFNPNDPLQMKFLNAIALGESGGAANAPSLGAGGTDLSTAPRDSFGFPQWKGWGKSHGAGIFQFEPGTWQTYASKYALDFSNPYDQYEGAWYLAQDTFAKKTGGDLETALQNGDYSSVQSALNGTWDTTGNGATPQGLAYDLAHGVAAPYYGGDASVSEAPSSTSSTDAPSSSGHGGITTYFTRGALIFVGALVALVALWWMASKQGIVPGPVETAKAAATA